MRQKSWVVGAGHGKKVGSNKDDPLLIVPRAKKCNKYSACVQARTEDFDAKRMTGEERISGMPTIKR